MIAYLTTSSRLSVVNKNINKDTNMIGPGTLLESAYEADDLSINKINNDFNKAFHSDLFVDKSRFAEAEFGIKPKADEHGLPLDDQGDGIRAFAGIAVATGLGERPILLIDEPETFLHPPQAFSAGRAIANLSQSDRQIFVATHSSEVLRGLMSSDHQMSIVRMSREASVFKQKELLSCDLIETNADPVSRSARVLDGLFFDGAVITESDGDDVFYRAVAEKFIQKPQIHYVNSYSKAASPAIAAVYEKLGVPSCAVTDFDMIRIKAGFTRACERLGIDHSAVHKLSAVIENFISNSATSIGMAAVLADQLSQLSFKLKGECGDEARASDGLASARSLLQKYRDDASAWAAFKQKGVQILTDAPREAFANIDEICRKKNLFIVPYGERESWLPDDVPYTKNKRKWTKDALDWLSKNDLPPDYELYKFYASVIDHILKSKN